MDAPLVKLTLRPAQSQCNIRTTNFISKVKKKQKSKFLSLQEKEGS